MSNVSSWVALIRVLCLVLSQEVDEDELTNRRATSTGREARGGVGMPMSSWNIDGDELPRADIDVR